ncbi:DUF421 domain-containing protein [Altererythrobacter sp. MF3-039]|uniref:DUF421 domain-containing protein n=1 Tax=Altererythrobacter sp. MF3-039 TaxID=3252901 RepID=UPI00390CB449
MFSSDPTFDLILRGLLLAAFALLWVILLIRLVGLRSLSKMTPFDFVMTVATGSLLAGAAQASEWGAFGQALLAIASLFTVQYIAARIRKASDTAEKAMQNEPVLLFSDGEFDEDALKQTRVAKSDVIAKLREANALDLSQVHAVVLESTGDVSVLHGGESPDDLLFEGVRKG